MMMVMRPPPSRSSLSTRPSRVLPRIKFYATLDYFLHFISQIKHICNFNIASLLIWSHQLRMHHPGVGYNEFVCGSAPRLIPCQPPPIMCGPDHDVSEARDATEGWAGISWEQSGIIVAGRAANQMHRKLLGTFHSVFAVIFIQCQIWNKKDGAFTNNNGKIAFPASWWVSDKSPFRCKRD